MDGVNNLRDDVQHLRDEIKELQKTLDYRVRPASQSFTRRWNFIFGGLLALIAGGVILILLQQSLILGRSVASISEALNAWEVVAE